MPFYAVARGHKIGVYDNWSECQRQTCKYTGAVFKKFETRSQAEEFVEQYSGHGPIPLAKAVVPDSMRPVVTRVIDGQTSNESFYAVAVGRKRGIYASWAECQAQVDGLEKREFRKFSNLKDAEEFLKPKNKKSQTPAKPYERPGGTRAYSTLAISRQSQESPVIGNQCTVYTDGACTNNGKANAKAGIGVYWGRDDPRNVSEPLSGRPTNNRAEIHAAVRAISQAKQQGFAGVTIMTDSQFMIKSMTEWLTGWKRKGWKTSAGQEVKNKEDFIQLEKASNGIEVNWIKVPAHSGVEGNEGADQLAVAGISRT